MKSALEYIGIYILEYTEGKYEERVGIYWGGTFGPERKPRAVIEPITQLPPPHPLSPPHRPEYIEKNL